MSKKAPRPMIDVERIKDEIVRGFRPCRDLGVAFELLPNPYDRISFRFKPMQIKMASPTMSTPNAPQEINMRCIESVWL